VTDRCKDEEADEHPRGASEKGLASAVVLDDVESVEGDTEIDTVLLTLATWTFVREE
jgi:hypothetical protein